MSMFYRPCGDLNHAALCMENNKYLKEFPNEFQQTQIHTNVYLLYRQRRGTLVRVYNHAIDDRYVMLYNEYLCRKLNAHIYVGMCLFVFSVEYIYLCIYKGYYFINVDISKKTANSEIGYGDLRNYLDPGYMRAPV